MELLILAVLILAVVLFAVAGVLSSSLSGRLGWFGLAALTLGGFILTRF